MPEHHEVLVRTAPEHVNGEQGRVIRLDRRGGE
jgi:hypothetical protein